MVCCCSVLLLYDLVPDLGAQCNKAVDRRFQCGKFSSFVPVYLNYSVYLVSACITCLTSIFFLGAIQRLSL